MFICPRCNAEVPDPDYIPAPPWWRRVRGASGRPMPICRRGHKLRSRLFGNLTELTLPFALIQGFIGGTLAFVFGILQDLRAQRFPYTHPPNPHIGLILFTALGLLFSAIAFIYAWRWAGVSGPVHRLTSRACGFAVGAAIPTVVALHALYFEWATPAEVACVQQLGRFIELTLQR